MNKILLFLFHRLVLIKRLKQRHLLVRMIRLSTRIVMGRVKIAKAKRRCKIWLLKIIEEKMLRYRFWNIRVLGIVDKLVIWRIIVLRNLIMLQVQMEVNKMVIGEVTIWLWDKVIKIFEKIVNQVYWKVIHKLGFLRIILYLIFKRNLKTFIISKNSILVNN